MTDAARHLVLRLEPPGWRWPGAADPRVSVLDALGRLAERSTLPHLLGPLFEGGAVGLAAASAVEAVLRDVPVGDLPGVETEVRSRASWWGVRAGQAWLDLTPRGLDRKAPGGWLRIPYHGLASFHPSGYVREAAVRALAADRSGRELPFVVLRLNDWVDAVRERAEATVHDRLVAGYAQAWGHALPLVLGLAGRQRHRSEGLETRVVALLAGDEDALQTVLTDGDRTIRRAAVRLALGLGGTAAESAQASGSTDSDLQVRLSVARAERAGQVTGDGTLLGDPAMSVRREILLGLVERDAPGADAALQRALLDAHGSIRHDARFFVSQRAGEPVAFADVYRQALADASRTGAGRDLRAALGGLAETGDAQDAASALPHLGDWRASVRAAALHVIVGLDPAGTAERIVAAAEDPSSRVARVAIAAIADGLPGVDGEAVLARLVDASAPHVRRQALRALAGFSHWSALPYLLKAAAHPDPNTATQAAEGLERWVASSTSVFTSPTAVDAASARQRLAHLVDAGALDNLARSVQGVLDRAS